MSASFVRRRTFSLSALIASVALVAACEDERVQAVDTGMTRDEVLSKLAVDARPGRPDSMPNVYERREYLIDGQKWEVLFFTDEDKRFPRDTVDPKDLRPIVLVDNRVVGKGWDFLDSVSTAKKIPLIKRD